MVALTGLGYRKHAGSTSSAGVTNDLSCRVRLDAEECDRKRDSQVVRWSPTSRLVYKMILQSTGLMQCEF